MNDDLLTPSDAEIAEAFGVEDVDDITDEMLADIDVPEVRDPLDVSEYKSAAGMAKAVHERLQHYAETIGHDPEAVLLYDPEEAAAKRSGHGHWTVAWEGGPYEWAHALLGGESLSAREFPSPGEPTPEVEGFHENDHVDAEPYYSFDLQFYER